MTGRSCTITFLILWAALAVGWDIVAEWQWGRDATISQVIIERAHASPVLAFAIGVVCGHLFWQMPK